MWYTRLMRVSPLSAMRPAGKAITPWHNISTIRKMPTRPVENPNRKRYRLNITVQMPEPVWDVRAYARNNFALGLNLRAVARYSTNPPSAGNPPLGSTGPGGVPNEAKG